MYMNVNHLRCGICSEGMGNVASQERVKKTFSTFLNIRNYNILNVEVNSWLVRPMDNHNRSRLFN